VARDGRWNHNLQYHGVLLDALPQPCERVLDVGCGEGMLALELSERAGRVTAIDIDGPTVDVARRDAPADNIDYVVGDVLTHDLEPGAFDAVVSVAALHHLGTRPGLARMGDLVRPGGRVAVLGVARSRYPADGLHDLAGTVAARVHRLTKTHWETDAPKVWPPEHSFADVRRIAAEVLPGVRYRRHVLWRCSLVWTKPAEP
jgi:2-polyprenyl-3-methyl-5-hydroxy-6-metoxy-1,4-benzoquinol methylase